MKSNCFKNLKNHLMTWRYQVSLFLKVKFEGFFFKFQLSMYKLKDYITVFFTR